MNELCDEVVKAADYKISVKDLADRGLTRARSYLTKVADLDGEWAQKHWREFPDLQRIRNLFAHGDGHLETGHAKQRKYAEASPHVAIKHDTVYLESTFLPYVLGLQRIFLLSLHEVVLGRFGEGS